MSLTVDALEVKEVGSVVHLVELQAHFHQVSCHSVLLTHSQMVRVYNLHRKESVCLCVYWPTMFKGILLPSSRS